MSYKIAIASSDEINIDETFGAAGVFHIYEVTGGTYVKSEVRTVEKTEQPGKQSGSQESCGTSGGCGSGGCHNGPGGGCAGSGEVSEKVQLVSDCRCVVCKKIGFNVQKQLERRAITSFDVSCTVEEALTKISTYFDKVDSHQSLRGIYK